MLLAGKLLLSVPHVKPNRLCKFNQAMIQQDLNKMASKMLAYRRRNLAKSYLAISS